MIILKFSKIKLIFPQVQLLQEFLTSQLERFSTLTLESKQQQSDLNYYLMGHCTEKSLIWNAQQQWQQIFHRLGISLTLIESGCCGMAGVYGHEKEHFSDSQGIYELSWKKHVSLVPSAQILATGYSCRSQVKRFSGVTLCHPAQILAHLLIPENLSTP
jgi:Fe-S oxidoreductase